jgi:hypothetical protein
MHLEEVRVYSSSIEAAEGSVAEVRIEAAPVDVVYPFASPEIVLILSSVTYLLATQQPR